VAVVVEAEVQAAVRTAAERQAGTCACDAAGFLLDLCDDPATVAPACALYILRARVLDGWIG
jgi:hypothetical protein